MRLISVGSNDNVDTDSDQDDGGSSQPVVPILDSRSVHSPTTPRVLVPLQAWATGTRRLQGSHLAGSNEAAFQPTPCGPLGVVR